VTQLQIIDFDAGISAVDTNYVRPGLDASHLIVEDGHAAFVDAGTSHSVPLLLKALASKSLEPAQVDWLLLTHVHLDHAGGAGRLMAELPNATAVLHPRGATHMADPDKLIQGSIAVYGRDAFNALYGEIVPIPVERIREVADGEWLNLNGRQLEFIHTEGHAKHHYCIVDRAADAIFTGDSFGLSYRELDTAAGPFIFPTTTPVHFDPAAAHASIERILSYRPRRVYLTHYSAVDNPQDLADQLHGDLDAYVRIALAHRSDADPEPAICRDLTEWTFRRLDAHGFDPDPARREHLIHLDMELNAQGLTVWLKRLTKGART